jgi:fructuronate reductase
MTRRLHTTTLADLPSSVAVPRYDRAGLDIGIVHMGLGAFHRAHQAVYTDDALNRAVGPWGICGISLHSPGTRDALAPQNWLYSVTERAGDGERQRIVGALREVLVAPEDPAAVLDRLTRPSVRIVTITVTEKGYCHKPATGALDEAHAGIRHDLDRPHEPRTLPGFLVEALDRRRGAGVAPFTVLSCDNLPSNGKVVAGILRDLADLRDPALARWIEDQVACPSTMIDRIVPATTDADRDAVAMALGLVDASPVVTEPFSQWVFEDRFPSGRPAWELEGAEPVADVAPYEEMKLRLLNASHSCIAYLGYLAGCETVADTIADPDFARFVRALMDEEVTPTLQLPPGADVENYKAALVARFANTTLRHRTWQIAMDGSQKLPQRLLATIRDRRAAGRPFERLALGVAAWMRYATGTDEQGRPIDVRDPLSARFAAIAAEAGRAPAALVPAFLALREVFDPALAADAVFAAAVTNWLGRLYDKGARACVAAAA